jgi:hypothetical protein
MFYGVDITNNLQLNDQATTGLGSPTNTINRIRMPIGGYHDNANTVPANSTQSTNPKIILRSNLSHNYHFNVYMNINIELCNKLLKTHSHGAANQNTNNNDRLVPIEILIPEGRYNVYLSILSFIIVYNNTTSQSSDSNIKVTNCNTLLLKDLYMNIFDKLNY